MDNVVNGKKIAEEVIFSLKTNIKKLKNPKIIFAIIQVGKNGESNIYIKRKKERADYLGIDIKHYKFDSDVTQNEIIKLIKKLNYSKDVCGIMVQLPLPKHLNRNKILNSISIKKDIDGLNQKNQKNIEKGKALFISPTALAVSKILSYYKISISDKKVVVIGNGKVAGRPISKALKYYGANVKVLTKRHSKNLAKYTLNADIIISAVGKEKLITKDMVLKKSILIDVGTTINFQNKLVGDLDFDKLVKDAYLISPTPGGVGVLTVCFLMKNVLKSYKNNL